MGHRENITTMLVGQDKLQRLPSELRIDHYTLLFNGGWQRKF